MEPLRIDHATCDEIGPAEPIGELAVRGRHVVLQIASSDETSLRDAIARLSRALPDHSVFRSGHPELWITVLRMISRAEIEQHRLSILAAAVAYRRTCATLVELRGADRLDPAWDAGEHGMECRFEHAVTGQIVEVPLESPARVDPYFFELFVKTTPEWHPVAALIVSSFHDASRMLRVLGM